MNSYCATSWHAISQGPPADGRPAALLADHDVVGVDVPVAVGPAIRGARAGS